MSLAPAHIIQLPFPASASPHPKVAAYYRDYGHAFERALTGYFVPEAGLWELPLWVAHLSGMLEELLYMPHFLDLSAWPAEAQTCAQSILAVTGPGERFLLSPLAQNFDLALDVSRLLMAEGQFTLLGGNMATLAAPGSASAIHRGQATPASLSACLNTNQRVITHRLGRGATADWRPTYRLLESYRGKVPLLRLHASHGCLFACDFCGDAWSHSLTVVPRDVLDNEVRQFERLFPETRLIYVGDKTFGQSPEAVRNLLAVFEHRPHYRFIVQTHVLALKQEVLEAMRRLGVIVVELGFESASKDLLRENRKSNGDPDFFRTSIRRLKAAGFRVVLNVLSGLPEETTSAHRSTLEFIDDTASDVWLYNLYNFVPYPLTTQYQRLRDRIVDWRFRNWREDGPPVFQPLYVSREESFDFFLQKVETAHAAVRRHALAEPWPDLSLAMADPVT
jgi:uncharacterized radical SAM superfamily protein